MQTPEDLSKERLIHDLVKLRERINELEKIKEEKEQYEAELARAKAMFEGLFEFAPDAILVIDGKGTIVQINQHAEKLFGYTREELAGEDHDIVVPDRFRERHLKDRKEYTSAPHVRRMGTGLELYGRRKDGTEFPVDIALGPLQSQDNRVTLAVVRDFTECKQALDKMARLAAYVEYSSDAIIGNTLEGEIVCWNPGAEIMYGYSADEVIGRSIALLSPPERPDDMPMIYEKVRLGESQGHCEIVHMRKDGTPIYVSLSISSVKDSSGNIAGTVTFARNITERKKIETDLMDQTVELKKRTAQVEEMNKELESFSYSVSHDLRAPLRAIDGYSRMILKQQGDTFDNNTKHQFNVIRDNAKRMEQLIDDILAFSRMGRKELSMRLLDVADLAKEVWGELITINPDRSIDLKIGHILPGMGDRSLIKQVLINILLNAIKFTKTRKVSRIEIGGHKTETENVYYVRDNGVGFDMQYHDRLFGVFQRLHSDKEYEGTGVGLAIVQRIIHRHGGRIWAEGEVGKGATFFFTLPKQQE